MFSDFSTTTINPGEMVIYMFSSSGVHIAILHYVKSFMNVKLLFLLLFVFPICNVISAESHFIPSDELEGDELLNAGLIDSLTWARLRPLYSVPLSVPEGRLELITDIFSDIEEIPEKEELKAYEPWENRDVQRFFNDYPMLEPMRHLLCFNSVLPGTSANLTINFTKPLGDGQSSQLMRFRYSPHESVSSQGRIGIDETKARWRSRNIAIQLPYLKIEAGNITQPLPGKIFYGHFTNYETEKSENGRIINNWLYPEARNWNGVTLGSSIDKIHSDISLFYHQREGERIFGGGVGIKKRSLELYTGISGFTLKGEQATYAHLFSAYRLSHFRFELETGADSREKIRYPLVFRSIHSVRANRLDLEFYHFPQGVCLHMSRMKRAALRTVNMSDYPETQVNGVNIRVNRLLRSGVRFSPELSIVRAKDSPVHLSSSAMISTNRPINIRFRYSCIADPQHRENLSHRTFLSLLWNPDQPFEVRLTQRYNLYHSGGYRYSYRLESPVNRKGVFQFTAYLRGFFFRFIREYVCRCKAATDIK
ncbi:hypothetical protein CHISP_2549 [Chitinispirillum alkaliphilum]|nr:hypothetical protein CHISP_2549 [Chitinispirillum alkaliphilum]